MSVAAIAAAVLPIIDRVLGRAIPDKGERDRLRADMAAALLKSDDALVKARAQIISAEASSKHELAAIWRPVLMLTFVAIVANNYVLAPYIFAVFGTSVRLDPPPQMWDLMQIGVGGYIVSRGAEKVTQTWRADGGR